MTETRSNFVGVDWIGLSFPQGVDRARVAAALEPLGVFFGEDWVEDSRDDSRFTYVGVGGRASLQSNRLRIDASGGFWPPEVLAAVAPPLLHIPGVKVHRFDFALEPPHGDLLYRRLKRAAIQGNYGGFEKASVVESWEGGEPAGETLYLGSRQSPSFSRFYRKVGRARWRLEREYKRERAGQSLQALVEKPTDPETLRVWAFGGLVFGERDRAHGHLDRIKPYSWWSKFSGCSRFQPLPPLPPVTSTLERSLAWVEQQVAPTWKTLQAAGYSERLRGVVAAAKPRSSVMKALSQDGDTPT